MEDIKFTVVVNVNKSGEKLSGSIQNIADQVGSEGMCQVILINNDNKILLRELTRGLNKHANLEPLLIENMSIGDNELRNLAINQAKGRYITFIDEEDVWSDGAFTKVTEFFSNHDDIDVVSCRTLVKSIVTGEAYHQDFKYNEDNVVDVIKSSDQIEDMCIGRFVRSDGFRERFFDANLGTFSECEIINQIIFDKGKYGLLSSVIFEHHVKDISDDMKLGNKRDYYLNAFKSFAMHMDEADDYFHKSPNYLRLLAMNYIADFIVYDPELKFDETDIIELKPMLIKILRGIDDKIILRKKGLALAYKSYLLKLKYGSDDFDHSFIISKLKMEITILNVEKNCIHIEGTSKLELAGQGADIYIEDNKGNKYELRYESAKALDKRTSMGTVALKGSTFKALLPLDVDVKYGFVLSDGDHNRKKMKIKFGKFARLSSAIENTYFVAEKYIVKHVNNKICVYGYTFKSQLACELRVDKELKTLGKDYLIKLRRKAIHAKRGKKRPSAVIIDRTNIAGDNAEALYRYMLKNHIDDGYDYCFGIDKNGRGYDKVSDLRNIVDYSSDDYKIKFLAADLIISSQWSDWVYNAFGEDRDYMKDLYGFKFVFLQHGIIRNDMSERGHKLKKNISLFITSTRREWDDVKSGSYGYNDDQVKLTGMPRYDSLENEPKKIVSFMPTWRYYVNITTTSGKSNREYSDVFKETGYYKFYNKLINDHRILSKMSEKGYKGNFYVHPLMEAQYVDFHGNDVISVAKGTADYNRAFKETSLMVTDYSSIDADYSIMKKPLIYCQFDKELFFSTHTYVEGYFDYAKDGFGPVRYDYESSVDTILEYLENDCKEEPEYAKRVDDFFQFTDRHNCERVLSEIRKLLG